MLRCDATPSNGRSPFFLARNLGRRKTKIWKTIQGYKFIRTLTNAPFAAENAKIAKSQPSDAQFSLHQHVSPLHDTSR